MDNWLNSGGDDDEQPQNRANAAGGQARRLTSNITNNDFVEEPLDDENDGLFSNAFREAPNRP